MIYHLLFFSTDHRVIEIVIFSQIRCIELAPRSIARQLKFDYSSKITELFTLWLFQGLTLSFKFQFFIRHLSVPLLLPFLHWLSV